MNAPSSPATVYLVDDDPSVLRAVARAVRAAGLNVATFSSAEEFLGSKIPDAPGCIVLDVTMPGLSGLDLQQALTRDGQLLPIIFLTGNGDIPMSVRAMKAGAADFLSKPCRNAELLEAIRQALARDHQLHGARNRARAFLNLVATLTPREHEVMLGVLAGRLNKQIAAALGTVEKTVKTHRGHMMAKLRVQSVADLVRECASAGIHPPAR